MKTIQITDPGKVRLIETTKPRLKPGHVLLKVAYVGFCGSDLNTFKGLNPLVQLPIVPGHEIGAIIEEVAEDVLNLKPGMMNCKSLYELRTVRSLFEWTVECM